MRWQAALNQGQRSPRHEGERLFGGLVHREPARGYRAAQGHQEQVVSGGAALVAKPGFHLFPKRLVHVLGHGLLVFGIHETREFSRRDRHPTVIARGPGEP